MTQAGGEVFDLGYQHYEGPREGRSRARMALWTNGVRTALGIGRGWPSKVLPGLLFVAVIIPAAAFSLIAATADSLDDIPSQADYYRLVAVVFLLAAAIIAPELLCPDRRDRVIDLYLVRPLTTTDYVVGRWLAFFSILLALAYLGQIVLFGGLTLAADQPLDYIRDNWLDVPRFLIAGVAIAAFTTTIPLAAATFTTRRAYAAAFVIILFAVSSPIAAILSLCEGDHIEGDGFTAQRAAECEPVTGDGAKWFALISLAEVPMHVSDLIFDDESGSELAELVQELPAVVPVAWFVLLTTGPGFVLWWRYRRQGL